VSVDAASHWVIRSDGNDGNGALFADLDPGTSIDYSNQASPQLGPLNDIATDGAGTGISSVTGGFTAAMVGNGIFLTGGGVTEDYYQITVYTDTNNITIDRSAGASKSGVTGRVGGAVLTVQDSLFEKGVAGNTFYIKKAGSAYAIPATVYISKAGTSALPITIEGFDTTLGDNPSGDDRPQIDTGVNYFRNLGIHWVRKNLRFTGSNSSFVCNAGSYGVTKNCEFINTGATAGAYALSLSSFNHVEDCDIRNPKGRGLAYSGGCSIVRTYIHDCDTYGVLLNATNGNFIKCTFDSCGYGIFLNSQYGMSVEQCTFYNNGVGIELLNGYLNKVWNNQFKNNTVGAHGNSLFKSNDFNYNNWHGNDADTTNVDKGDDPTADDPGFAGFISGTDLVCSDHTGPTYTVTSATGDFDSEMVGKSITVLDTGDGGHFVVGNYMVVTYVSATEIELATDPTDGNNDVGGDWESCYDFSGVDNPNGFGMRLAVG